jgi:signal transduction histidine kinase
VSGIARADGVADSRSGADAWAGGERRWDAYFGLILLGTLAVVQVVGSAPEHDRIYASIALAAMVPWYVFVGRSAFYETDQPVRGAIYLAGLVPLLVVTELCIGIDSWILLALCPQCFMALSYRRAIAAVIVLNSVPLAIALARHGTSADITTAAGAAVLGIVFSIAFGTWIIKIINQSAERAELIAQLERTRAELAEAYRDAGVLAERERLASEIHDTLAQGFTSIVMLAQAAEAVIETDPAQARHQLDLVGRTARENLAEARALVSGLTPAALGSATLSDALARLTDRFGSELGVDASFTVSGEPVPLSTGTEVVLLRVCQEALSNVRKHAKAGVVRVALIFPTGAKPRLEVRDAGVGFEPELISDGFGLRGMRARVDEIGGTLSVTSAPGEGTLVSAEVS